MSQKAYLCHKTEYRRLGFPIHINSLYRNTFYNDLPIDATCNPDIKTLLCGYIDVKSPEKSKKMGRNAITASRDQMACVCFTDHILSYTDDFIKYRTNLLWKDPNYTQDYIFWYVNGKLIKYKRP